MDVRIPHRVEAPDGWTSTPADASLIAANASKDSVVKSSPELIAAYAAAYQAQEKKLNDPADRPCFQAVNDVAISTTDPDAGPIRKGGQGRHPAYHHPRAVDDANNHGFKRARWRRLWRQQIQDYLIAATQNIRILLARRVLKPSASAAAALERVIGIKRACLGALLDLTEA